MSLALQKHRSLIEKGTTSMEHTTTTSGSLFKSPPPRPNPGYKALFSQRAADGFSPCEKCHDPRKATQQATPGLSSQNPSMTSKNCLLSSPLRTGSHRSCPSTEHLSVTLGAAGRTGGSQFGSHSTVLGKEVTLSLNLGKLQAFHTNLGFFFFFLKN